MIQGVLNISGHELPDPDRATPAVAAATMVGLTDHDLNVNDDQSFVATDFYSEQIKTVHVTLTGTGAHAGQAGGRVTIAAVKSGSYSGKEIEIKDYHGSLYYSSGFFFMKRTGPFTHLVQRGSALVNISLVGNAMWGDNATEALTIDLDPKGTASLSTLGNVLADYDSAVYPPGQTVRYPDKTTAATNGTTAAALGDFRRLGALDLALNHPGVL